MAARIEIVLRNRKAQATLHHQGRAQLVLDRSSPKDQPERLVRCIPETLSAILSDAAIQLNMRKRGEERQPDIESLVQKIEKGQVEVAIRAEPREIEVAALYLRHDYGLPRERLSLEPFTDNRPSVYDTFGAHLGVQPLEALAADVESVDALIAELDKRERKQRGRTGNVVLDRLLVQRQFTLGVLGDTGAGKTTMLNAMMGQPDLLPVDYNICTAASTTIKRAASKSAEGWEVMLLKPAEREELCSYWATRAQYILSVINYYQLSEVLGRPFWKSLTSKMAKGGVRARLQEAATKAVTQGTTDAEKQRLTKEAGELVDKLQALEDGMIALIGKSVVSGRRLKDVHRFLTATREVNGRTVPNGLPMLASRVQIGVHHPLLDYLRLVDTPGLGDPEQARSKLTLDVLSGLHGWMLLVNGSAKENTKVESTLDTVRNHAHVVHGMIVGNKVDQLPYSDQHGSKSFDDLFSQRRKYYSKLTREVVYCTAKAAAFLPQDPPGEDRQLEVLLNEWNTATYGIRLCRGWVPEIPVHPPLFDDHLPLRELGRAIRSQGRTAWQALRDLQLELSGVLQVVHALCSMLESALIQDYVASGRDSLAKDLEVSIKNHLQAAKRLEDQLAADSQKDVVSKQIDDIRREKDITEASIKSMGEELERKTQSLQKDADAATRDVRQRASSLESTLPQEAKKEALKKQSGKLTGSFSFSIAALFTDVLVIECNKQMREVISKAVDHIGSLIWVNRQQVLSAVQAHASNFSFQDSGKVDSHEEFWEWWDTAAARAAESAKTKAAEIRREIDGDNGSFPQRLRKIMEAATKVAEAEIDRLRVERKRQQKTYDELVKLLRGLEARVHLPRTDLETELNDEKAAIERLEEMRRRVTLQQPRTAN